MQIGMDLHKINYPMRFIRALISFPSLTLLMFVYILYKSSIIIKRHYKKRYQSVYTSSFSNVLHQQRKVQIKYMFTNADFAIEQIFRIYGYTPLSSIYVFCTSIWFDGLHSYSNFVLIQSALAYIQAIYRQCSRMLSSCCCCV